MRALCISGGGSMGAWAGGVVEFLKLSNKDWDKFFGTSTGSLMIPLVACDKVAKLKKAYTSISPDDIFSLNPFKVKSVKGGEFRFKLNHINIIKNFIRNGTSTLGDSSNLKQTIKNFLSQEEYQDIIDLKKEVVVSVCNLSTEELEMKSNLNQNYDDFIDWMVASSSATPFMSIVEKNGFDYADGGILRYIPILEAIESGATEIDAIVLMEYDERNRVEKIRNVLHLIGKMIKIFLKNRKEDDTDLKRLSKLVDEDEVIINFYYLPRKITNNPYIFDSNIMSSWWEEAFEFSQNGPTSSYRLRKGRVKKLI